MASGTLLLFLDADVVPAPDIIGRIRQRFEDPHLDALIGSYDDTPGHPGFLSQYRNLLHHYTHQTGNRDAVTFWGACGAIRRGAFAEVGGFDVAFDAPIVEDIDLGYRLRRAGTRILLDPEIQVCHLKAWPLLAMVRTDVLLRAAPWTRLLLRYNRLDNDLNVSVSGRVSVFASCALLVTLVASALKPTALVASAILALLLVGLNRDFYAFLARRKGAGFALRAVPAHWVYFMCAGIGSALGLTQHIAAGWPKAPHDRPDPTLARPVHAFSLDSDRSATQMGTQVKAPR